MTKHECLECSSDFEATDSGSKAKFCSDKCRKANSRKYTSENIKVLEHSDMHLDPRFDWKLIENLSKDYCKDVEFIKRGIESCRNAGVSPNYFIDRYLKLIDIPINKEVNKQSKLMQGLIAI